MLAAMSDAALAAFEDYEESTLREVFAINASACGAVNEKATIVDAAGRKFKAPAVWSGDLRPIEAKTALLLATYIKALRLNVDPASLFKNEVRVSDGVADYWLPIQEQILPMFKKEVGKEGSALLYVAFIGCYKDRVVVTINEFQGAGSGP
jgi:hypothetical protein